MKPTPSPTSFAAFLRVTDAARYLGVSANTLRSWDQQGKLPARRHPLNGYRLYERGELDELLRSLHASVQAEERHGRSL
jgi:excisionase family DNA binding protein